MARAEQEDPAYLFRLRMTANVRRSVEPAMRQSDWQDAGQVTLTISSTHGMRDKARRGYVRIAGFLAELRKTAEQLDRLERW